MKRYWIGFEESGVKALLINTQEDVTIEDVRNKVSGYGTISFEKEEDFSSKPWQYTNTQVKSWEEL